jgi:hypothetical protein
MKMGAPKEDRLYEKLEATKVAELLHLVLPSIITGRLFAGC